MTGHHQPQSRHPSPEGTLPGSPQLLRHVVEVELEVALQSVFSTRQDLTELTVTSADRRVVERALETLETVTTGLRVLLALLRAFGGAGREDPGLFDRTSGAFAVVRHDGEVLYMNSAVTTLMRRDHRDVAATPFSERTWCDREQMRRHLELAHAEGVAEDDFDVLRGDGVTIRMRLHTRRMDVNDEGVLLMNYVGD